MLQKEGELTVEQVAMRADVSAATVWRWLKAGKLQALKRGRNTFFLLESVDEFLTPKPHAVKKRTAHPFKLTEEPCERCLGLARDREIRVETVQRLPAAPWTPLAQDRSGPCCFDCASADALMRLHPGAYTFAMARIAVGNDRQEQYRLPGAPMGLVGPRIVRPSVKGDLEDQHAWLERMYWFHIDEERR